MLRRRTVVTAGTAALLAAGCVPRQELEAAVGAPLHFCLMCLPPRVPSVYAPQLWQTDAVTDIGPFQPGESRLTYNKSAMAVSSRVTKTRQGQATIRPDLISAISDKQQLKWLQDKIQEMLQLGKIIPIPEKHVHVAENIFVAEC